MSEGIPEAKRPESDGGPASEKWERQQHIDNVQIIVALNRVADELVATEKQEKSSDRRKELREYLTIFLIFITVAAAIGSDWIFYATMIHNDTAATKQLGEMQTQSTTAQKEFELSQRPWISADFSAGGLTWKDGEPSLTLEIRLKNTGHSPGLAVFPYASAVAVIGPDGLAKQKELSDIVRHHPSTLGDIIFPGDGFLVSSTVSIGHDEIEAYRQSMRTLFPKLPPAFDVPISIIVIIDYRFIGSDVHHQTGYYFNLFRHDPTQPPNASFGLTFGENVAAQDIRLVNWSIGQYAD